MDYLKFIVSNKNEESISIQRVNILKFQIPILKKQIPILLLQIELILAWSYCSSVCVCIRNNISFIVGNLLAIRIQYLFEIGETQI